MAERISRMSTSELRRALENARSRVNSIKAKSTEVAGQALQTVEIGGTAFGLGYLRGRMADNQGEWKVLGVQPELLAAVGAHGLAFMGAFGKYSEHMHNVGDGALAAFLAAKGMDFGVTAKSSGIAPNMPQMMPRQNFGTAFDYATQGVAPQHVGVAL